MPKAKSRLGVVIAVPKTYVFCGNANKASLVCKTNLFCMQRSLVWQQKKASF